MVLSCKSRFVVGLVGCNPAQHLSVLTQQLHYCLADSALLQPLSRGSMLALALISLELENICPDWLALTINLLRKTQVLNSHYPPGQEKAQVGLQYSILSMLR